MARRRQGGEVDPLDKKKVTRNALKEAMGIFRYVLPYRFTFILGMVFLLLSTGSTLIFPYFLGELVDSAKPQTHIDQTLKEMKGKLQAEQSLSAADLENITEAIGSDSEQYRENTASLKEKIDSGQAIDASDLDAILKPTGDKQQIPGKQINQVALILAIILIIQGVFSYLRIYLFAQVSERSMADIRADLYKKIITLPILFFEQRRVGELTSRISSDVTQLQDVLSITLAEFLRQILTLVIGIGILVFLSPKLTVFMLATFPLLVIAALFFGRFIRKLSKKSQDELANANTVVEETFQAITIVKAFANEMIEVLRYRKALGKVVDAALQAARYRGGFVTFIFIALFGGIILVIWFGAHMINDGEIRVGELVSFMFYTAFIGGSVAGMGSLYGQLQKTIGASERVREMLDMESEFELKEKAHDAPRLKGEIEFSGVEFSYPTRKDVQVLQGIDLKIEPGEKVALVGHSGAGKSTIAQLIMHFYDIEGGELLIDSKSIESYSLPDLRGNIGIVPQEVILFGGTIRENIAYGRPNASEEEIREAARRANALDFIESFPEALDTVVGERGIKLSGGQRQRVAIARAILNDPAILVLDEATSSLDAESEHLVQGALNELMAGRTTVIIAHRLSTIREVDRIYVLDQGRIIETGTHLELSGKEGGVYNNLLQLQLEQR